MDPEREEPTAALPRRSGLERHRDWLYGVVVAAIGLTIVLLTPYVTNDESLLLQLESRALLPSFYPTIVGWVITAVGAWIAVREVLARLLPGPRPDRGSDDGAATARERASSRTLVFAFGMGVYAFVVNQVGFRSATVVFAVVVARWLGASWPVAIAVGIVLMVVIALVFIGLLGVPLPDAIY